MKNKTMKIAKSGTDTSYNKSFKAELYTRRQQSTVFIKKFKFIGILGEAAV